MGPCVKILLRNILSDEQFRTMDSWLVNKSKSFEGTPGYREVWIDQGTFSGCPDDEPCCISVIVQGHAPNAEPILYPDEVNAVLGYLPAQVIEISAGCNRRLDHYQIGHLALHFAQTYDGIIDMIGEITPSYSTKS